MNSNHYGIAIFIWQCSQIAVNHASALCFKMMIEGTSTVLVNESQK